MNNVKEGIKILKKQLKESTIVNPSLMSLE